MQIKARESDLIVLGTADRYYDQAYLIELQKVTDHEILLIDGADRSMEIKGNVMESLKILGEVTRSIQAFLSRLIAPKGVALPDL